MPRAFKEEEKEKIRAKLLEAGRACFLRYGLKKTTIEDLTKGSRRSSTMRCSISRRKSLPVA